MNKLNSDLTKSMSVKKFRFTEMLIEENNLDQSGFESWIFCNGMLFNSPDKWWGDYGRRDYPHEGVDLCLYRDRSGGIDHIDEKTRIPVMQNGVIKAISEDYLGQAIIIEHESIESNLGRFISFYAHTKPHADLEVGMMVREGDIIATIADTNHSKAHIIPHLHFSLGRPSESFSYDEYLWSAIRKPEKIILLDPLSVIDWPYQALDAGERVCRELWSRKL
jgi:murein DD-endopeptidase MepM/ murein hydrolase activator NlpD